MAAKILSLIVRLAFGLEMIKRINEWIEKGQSKYLDIWDLFQILVENRKLFKITKSKALSQF